MYCYRLLKRGVVEGCLYGGKLHGWVFGHVTALKKKGKKKKIPAGPHLSAPPSLPLCFAPRAADARIAVAGVQPRETRHVPAILVSRAAPSLFPRPLLIRVKAGPVPRLKP